MELRYSAQEVITPILLYPDLAIILPAILSESGAKFQQSRSSNLETGLLIGFGNRL